MNADPFALACYVVVVASSGCAGVALLRLIDRFRDY